MAPGGIEEVKIIKIHCLKSVEKEKGGGEDTNLCCNIMNLENMLL